MGCGRVRSGCYLRAKENDLCLSSDMQITGVCWNVILSHSHSFAGNFNLHENNGKLETQ